MFPIYILAGIYVYNDPFKVAENYKTYQNIPMELNQNYIGWQTFLNYKDSLHYDSFILGNSCTIAYPTGLWKKFIGDSEPIRLYGAAESLCAINQKVKRLDELGCPIRNALILLDYYTLQKIRVHDSHMKVPHPDVTGESPFAFQLKFVAAFLNPNVLIPYLDFSLFKTYRPYMEGVINTKEINRNQLSNDVVNPRELEISQKKELYWKDHRNELPERKIKEAYPPIVNGRQKSFLTEIKRVLDKHHTNFRIIINPEWCQKKMDPRDIIALKAIFGDDYVFDFSGKNEFTDDYHNYYEEAHYRPVLGEKILNIIY